MSHSAELQGSPTTSNPQSLEGGNGFDFAGIVSAGLRRGISLASRAALRWAVNKPLMLQIHKNDSVYFRCWNFCVYHCAAGLSAPAHTHTQTHTHCTHTHTQAVRSPGNIAPSSASPLKQQNERNVLNLFCKKPEDKIPLGGKQHCRMSLWSLHCLFVFSRHKHDVGVHSEEALQVYICAQIEVNEKSSHRFVYLNLFKSHKQSTKNKKQKTKTKTVSGSKYFIQCCGRMKEYEHIYMGQRRIHCWK